MVDESLSLPQYEALTQAFNPFCSGCFDMNPSLFDFRAVRWATSYPILSPQKIVTGAGNHCLSCEVIKKAFQSVGLELHTLYDTQYVSLYNKAEKGSLLATAVLDYGRSVAIEMFTVPGEFLSLL